MKRFNLILMLFLLYGTVLSAQNLTVRGTVYDKSTNESLIGVSVRVDGTTMGTITDINGNYQIDNVARGARLVFSYVGMKPASREVSAAGAIDVYLESETKDLDEVIVVGYGTARKRDLTGSIVSISGESLKTSPDYNPVKALQGKVPGLLVTVRTIPVPMPITEPFRPQQRFLQSCIHRRKVWKCFGTCITKKENNCSVSMDSSMPTIPVCRKDNRWFAVTWPSIRDR